MAHRRGANSGSISFRKDRQIYQGVVTIGYDASGKRKRRVVYGKTKRAVQEKLTRLQGQKLDGTLGELCKLRLSEYFAHWLQTTAQRTLRQTTYQSYESLVRLHINPYLGGFQLRKLEPNHIDSLFQQLTDAGVSLKRQRKVYAVLRRALNLALKRGLVPRNVCLAVEMPKVELREMQPLTQEQAIRFLQAARQDRLEAYYVLALMLGMRQGELIGLEWSDLDVSSGTLFVRRTLNESNGQFVAGPPKTKRGTRRIPLPRKVLTALEDHRERMQAEGHREIERVFCDSKGGPLRRQNVQRRSFKPLLKRAKCPAIRFHDLRHTYATLALANNVPLRVVADTLGHSRTSVTMDVYAHVLPTQARDAATAMDGLFG
ncbi:MAG: site-specific integrase [Planctomycetaceae bacterium]